MDHPQANCTVRRRRNLPRNWACASLGRRACPKNYLPERIIVSPTERGEAEWRL